MPIRAVIFDIGDVLEVNPRTDWAARWADRLQLDTDEFKRRVDPIWGPGSVGAVTLAEIERQIGEALDLDRSTITALMEDVWAEYVGTLNSELARYFVSLRPRYKTGILSNSFVGAREREQDAYGFGEMCDALVYSHEVGYLKPDARIYRIACDLLDVTPEETVLLDDVPANVEGAKAVGMNAIRFGNNSQAIAELEVHLSA